MLEASILFPGQGSQVAGMGRDLADASPEAMSIWKKAEAASRLPLREIYWDGDAAAMSDTKALQPALTAFGISLWQAAAPKVRPLACAGHSLGEYIALAACGILSVEEALSLVSLRGALMAECDPDGKGAMSAVVKIPLEKVESLVEETRQETGKIILIANYNTPAQYVISGEKEAVALAGVKAKALKGRAIPLAVSGAFHSPCMAEAAKELVHPLQKATWNKPRTPFFSNVTATALNDGESAKEAMCVQMTSPVRWIELMENEYKAGLRNFLEVGAKAVLSKMASLCTDHLGEEKVQTSLICNLDGLQSL